MDIHPEAVKLLNKHRGTDFRPGGEHYVENLTATNAVSEALNERDEALAKIEEAQICASETMRSWKHRCYAVMGALGLNYGDPDWLMPDDQRELDSLRAQVAAMREALDECRVVIKFHCDPGSCVTMGDDRVVSALSAHEKAVGILSTLKDQSNDH